MNSINSYYEEGWVTGVAKLTGLFACTIRHTQVHSVDRCYGSLSEPNFSELIAQPRTLETCVCATEVRNCALWAALHFSEAQQRRPTLRRGPTGVTAGLPVRQPKHFRAHDLSDATRLQGGTPGHEQALGTVSILLRKLMSWDNR